MKFFNAAFLAFAAAPSLVQATTGPTGKLFEWGDCTVKGKSWNIDKGAENQIEVPVELHDQPASWFSAKYLPCEGVKALPPVGASAGMAPKVHVSFQNPGDVHIDDKGKMFCVQLDLYLGNIHQPAAHTAPYLVASKQCKVNVVVDDEGTKMIVVNKNDFIVSENQQGQEIDTQNEEKTTIPKFDPKASTSPVYFYTPWQVCVRDDAGAALKIDQLLLAKKPFKPDGTAEGGTLDITKFCDTTFSPVNKPNPTVDVCCRFKEDFLNVEFYKLALGLFFKFTVTYDFSPHVRRLGAPDRLLQEEVGTGAETFEQKVDLVQPDLSGAASHAGLFMAGAVAALGMLVL